MENTKNEGLKDKKDKLDYELDWDFITSMAEKMQLNKDKYPPYNWKKPMDIENLKQALFRHTIQVMKNNFNDQNELDHLSSIALNAMFIYCQLANKTNDT